MSFDRNIFLGVAASSMLGLGIKYFSGDHHVESSIEPLVSEERYEGPVSLDLLHDTITNAGYDINKKDTIKLARVIHRETRSYDNNEGLDAVTWSIRNHVETARVWEQYDDSYPKGNTIGAVLQRGQYDAIDRYPNIFRDYDVNSDDPFVVKNLDRNHMDRVLESILNVFSTPLEQDPICGASLYKNDAASTQQWHRNMGASGRQRGQFGYLQDYDGREVGCWHEYIGTRGVNHRTHGVHKFYRVECDLSAIGQARGKQTGWTPLVSHYDPGFCNEE